MGLMASNGIHQWQLGGDQLRRKMTSRVWLKPKVVVRIDFAEWTGADKVRHTKFVGLREDKDPQKVVREI